MEITNIRIYPFESLDNKNRVRAYAEVELSNTILIRGIRLLVSETGGLFVGMPSIRSRSGDYKDIIVIKNKEFAADLRRRLVDAFNNYGSDPGRDHKEKANES